jgi:hypothetical protein
MTSVAGDEPPPPMMIPPPVADGAVLDMEQDGDREEDEG